MSLGEHKEAHIKNIHATNAAIEGLLTSLTAKSKKFKEGDAPEMKAATKQMKSNAEQSKKSTHDLVEPDKVGAAFGDAKKFEAELIKIFPTETKRL